MDKLELALVEGSQLTKKHTKRNFYKEYGGVLLKKDGITQYYLGETEISHEEYLKLKEYKTRQVKHEASVSSLAKFDYKPKTVSEGVELLRRKWKG